MKILYIFAMLLFVFSCSKINSNSYETLIQKDLDSRFTGFEIVEIKPDTANIYTALNNLRSLKLKVASTNLSIISAIADPREKTPKENYLYVNSLQDSLVAFMTKFEDSKYDKVDRCYYVKFLIFREENKVPVEEYYYIDKNNGDVLHRPFIWEDFLQDEGYNKLIEDALKYNDLIYNMPQK